MQREWTMADEERAERETTREMLRDAIKVDLFKKRFQISLALNAVFAVVIAGLLMS